MSSLHRRLARLELIGRPGSGKQMTQQETAAFWDAHLSELSDAQLDRLEDLIIAIGAKNPPNDALHTESLTSGQLLELRAIYAAMGLDGVWADASD